MAKSILDFFPKRVFDQNAHTINEIAKLTNNSVPTARIKTQRLVEEGTAEQVWKRVSGKPVKAYRMKV